MIAEEYQRWIAKLMGYNSGIEYKRGMENSAADALSRLPPTMELGKLSVVDRLNIAVFREQVYRDETLNGIREALENGQPTPEGCSLCWDLLHYKGRLVLSATLPTIPLLFDKFHISPVGGHQGALKTYQQLAKEVYC